MIATASAPAILPIPALPAAPVDPAALKAAAVTGVATGAAEHLAEGAEGARRAALRGHQRLECARQQPDSHLTATHRAGDGSGRALGE